MPRKPRFNLVGLPQHIIQRGNNREPCFYAEEDYRRYLDDLSESADKLIFGVSNIWGQSKKIK